MENTEKQKILDVLIPLLEGLKPSDWHWLVSNIEMAFSKKAAQCKLDGSDLELIKKSIQRDWIN